MLIKHLSAADIDQLTSENHTARLVRVFQVFLGGSIVSDGPVKVLEDFEEQEQPSPRFIKVSLPNFTWFHLLPDSMELP